jgi:uncharacterized protein
MQKVESMDYAAQADLIAALHENLLTTLSVKKVQLIETHISWLLLAGKYAYKIKKAVNFGFLDFSSLTLRQYYCAEEIRLNRRFAPSIYLDVVEIGGSAAHPKLNAEPVIEYAVRMRRFAIAKQFDNLLARNKLLPDHIESLANTVAAFHRSLLSANEANLYGSAEAVSQHVWQNFELLQSLLKSDDDLLNLDKLRHMTELAYASCHVYLEQRLRQGFIRECHGDLHLGNIVLIQDQAVPFDGIEFNPALRWIDVMSDVAFTVMDLLQQQRADLAYRFLNGYLETTGDYAGLSVLHFYLSYRAMVRAKVAAIRFEQPALTPRAAAKLRTTARGYLNLAESCLKKSNPVLIITHGFPGSGKSTFAQLALERFQAIRLRSDVERKRLYGLDRLADSHQLAGVDLYSAEVTQRTYAQLKLMTRELLLAGCAVVVDAAFITQAERAAFRQLAQEMSIPFVIAAVHASDESLRVRIRLRQQAANDPSEADVAVMEKLRLNHDPLTADERLQSVLFLNEGPGIAADLAAWEQLDAKLSGFNRCAS